MKLRQIVATEGIPGSIPAGTPQGWAAPAQALAAGAQDVGRETQRAASIYAHAADLLQKAKAKAELDLATEQLKTRFADEDIKLRSEGTDPDQYPALLAERLKNVASTLSDGFTTPEAKAAWQGTVARFGGEKLTAAKYDALTMKREQIKLLWSTVRRENAITAVYGKTDQEKAEAYAKGVTRSQEGLASGVYTGAEAVADRAAFLAEVERGQIERDSVQPETRALVLDRLNKGDYPHFGDVAAQKAKAREIADRVKTEQREKEAHAEKMTKREADVFTSRFIDSFNTGRPADRMDRATLREGLKNYEGYISRDAQVAMLAMVEKPELEGGITNPSVYNELRIRILANPQGFDTDTILREPPLRLSAKDKGDLLKMVHQAKDEKDVSRSPFYQKGREQIMIHLGGVQTGLPEFLAIPILKPVEAALLATTLFEFDRQARTDPYQKNPERLTQLGRDMALAAKGQPTTPLPQTPISPPPVQLPRAGETPTAPSPKAGGSKKAIPR